MPVSKGGEAEHRRRQGAVVTPHGVALEELLDVVPGAVVVADVEALAGLPQGGRWRSGWGGGWCLGG